MRRVLMFYFTYLQILVKKHGPWYGSQFCTVTYSVLGKGNFPYVNQVIEFILSLRQFSLFEDFLGFFWYLVF